MDYTSKHAIMGMMSSRYIPLDDWSGFIKNKKEVVLFNPNLIDSYKNYEKISLCYLKEIPKGLEITSKYNSNLLISQFNCDFFKLSGKKHREMRETRNQLNKIVKTEHEISNICIVVDFIREWNKTRGDKKYGWQLHSGYDISFFERFYEQEKDNLWSNFFYIDGVLVGYSIISKMEDKNCFDYIIRKSYTSWRNLCLYVDFKSLERVWIERQKEFLINWGCSGGSLLTYKKKFPIYSCEKRYFVKIKNEYIPIRQNEFEKSLFD